MPTPTQNDSIKHQVYIERYKTQVENDFLPFLKRIDKSLRLQLSGDELTELSRTRVEKQLSATRKMLQEIYDDWGVYLNDEFKSFSVYEAKHEVKLLNDAVVSDVDLVVPTTERLQAAFLTTPLSVRGVDGGKLLEPFIKDYAKSDIDLLTNQIRQGYFEGRTNSQMLKDIRGTVSANYKNGTLAQVNNHAKSIVRTSVQHISSTARRETWKNNDDLVIGYEISATLDGKTSEVCRGLDGRRFLFKDGDGPHPPLHIRCRSGEIPVLSEEFDYLDEGATRASRDPETGKSTRVSANETYYSWLKKQDPEFIKDTIGANRAKLLLNGGMTSEEFTRLQLNKNFKPLTLAEMERKNPLAFAKAGIQKSPG